MDINNRAVGASVEGEFKEGSAYSPFVVSGPISPGPEPKPYLLYLKGV